MTTQTAVTPQPYHHGDLRRALIVAGLELAREGGPPAIVLREVARRVGVSPNAAYRHFKGFPELLDAVAEAARAELAKAMDPEGKVAPTGDPLEDARARMFAVGRGYVRFALTEPGLFAVAFSRAKESEHFTSTRAGGASPGEVLQEALNGLIEAGLLDPEERAAAATTAWAAVHGLSGLLLGPMREIAPAARDEMIEATLAVIGRGLTGGR